MGCLVAVLGLVLIWLYEKLPIETPLNGAATHVLAALHICLGDCVGLCV